MNSVSQSDGVCVINTVRHKIEIGPAKRNKVRIVDFGNRLAEILKREKSRQKALEESELKYANYCRRVFENGREHYEIYALEKGENGTGKIIRNCHLSV
ncbi:hypothetical protein [Ruminococcus sp. HUN007]|uniref:hypothetical protein n=1 Tax=Ruminococcus sp. HUN007 TaxID=1514668 RepID=UPI0006798591|nr:hypothetical protein [Ruminococcus sp. HUN007]